MKISYDKIVEQNPKNVYVFTIETMEGDADDWHNFEIAVDSLEEAKKLIVYCEVMSKQYPNGRGGGTGFYEHLDFFDEYFEDEWYYDDGVWMDSWENYSVIYYNVNGEAYKCEITLEDEDLEKINSYEVKK